MKGVVIQPDHRLALTDVEEPKIREEGDAIVRVSVAAICGSDVHAKHGFIPGATPGTLLGHEFVGRHRKDRRGGQKVQARRQS